MHLTELNLYTKAFVQYTLFSFYILFLKTGLFLRFYKI